MFANFYYAAIFALFAFLPAEYAAAESRGLGPLLGPLGPVLKPSRECPKPQGVKSLTLRDMAATWYDIQRTQYPDAAYRFGFGLMPRCNREAFKLDFSEKWALDTFTYIEVKSQESIRGSSRGRTNSTTLAGGDLPGSSAGPAPQQIVFNVTLASPGILRYELMDAKSHPKIRTPLFGTILDIKPDDWNLSWMCFELEIRGIKLWPVESVTIQSVSRDMSVRKLQEVRGRAVAKGVSVRLLKTLDQTKCGDIK